MSVKFQVTIDALEPATQAAFWAEALGYVPEPPPAGHPSWQDFLQSAGVPEERWGRRAAVVDPDGYGPRLYFQEVPEDKVVKNRVHLDLAVGGGPGTDLERRCGAIIAGVTRLESLGANILRRVEEDGDFWVVMEDPEGNEFCVM